MNLTTQQRFFDLVAENDLKTAFEELEQLIQQEAPLLMVDLTMLRRRFQVLEEDAFRGTISPADQQVEESKIVRDFLYLVQQLPTDQERELPGSNQGRASGKLMHDIPSRFPLGKLTKCVIRIADSKEALLKDFTVSLDTVLEENVPIEKVMAVELIDLEDGKHFEIKRLNSTIQQLLPALATQWVYYVKALTPGEHLLVLRVSTVEVIDGIERAKEVIFERPVKVEAEVTETTEPRKRQWQPTKVVVATPRPINPTLMGSADAAVSMEQIREAMQPASPPMPSPSVLDDVAGMTMGQPKRTIPPAQTSIPAPAPKSKNSIPWGKMAATFLVLVLAGWWVVNLNDDNQNTITPGGGITTLPGPTAADTISDSEKYANNNKEESINEDNNDDSATAAEIPLPSEAFVGTYVFEDQDIEILIKDGSPIWKAGRAESRLDISGTSFLNLDNGRAYRFFLDEDAMEIDSFASQSGPVEIWVKQ